MKCAAAKTRSSLVMATLNSPPILGVNLLGGRRLARRHPPHLVGEPFQALLAVIELGRRHRLGAARDLAGMAQELVQDLPQRPVDAPLGLRDGRGGGGGYAVWMPEARSSAWRSSSTAARTVDAAPCSAK